MQSRFHTAGFRLKEEALHLQIVELMLSTVSSLTQTVDVVLTRFCTDSGAGSVFIQTDSVRNCRDRIGHGVSLPLVKVHKPAISQSAYTVLESKGRGTGHPLFVCRVSEVGSKRSTILVRPTINVSQIWEEKAETKYVK